MYTIIGIILGWLFGILGQRPIIYIQNSFKKQPLKKSIFVELNDLKCHLAVLSFIIYSRIGKIDREYLLWIQSIIKTYNGFYEHLKNPKEIDILLQIKEEDFEATVELMKKSEDLNKGLSLKKFNMPFIDSNYSQIHLFNTKFQEGILEIREEIRRINEQIDLAWFYFFKTFDSDLSENNAKIIRDNLEFEYLNIGKKAVNISKNINVFIDRSG
ncbi:MAG: hypothetical protein ACLPSL_01625 [Smithella sp.]